jgi:hypothetical protein
LELKAWQLARERVGQRIRKQVWDNLEVKGRSIKVNKNLFSFIFINLNAMQVTNNCIKMHHFLPTRPCLVVSSLLAGRKIESARGIHRIVVFIDIKMVQSHDNSPVPESLRNVFFEDLLTIL